MIVKVYTCPEPFTAAFGMHPRIFLAGGITHCPWWQSDAISLLHEGPLKVYVLNPRRENFPIHDPNATKEQIAWEYQHLHISGNVTLFWFPKTDPKLTVQPIALFELGMALGKKRDIAIGVEPGYPREADVYEQCALADPDLVVHDTLADTVRAAVDFIR